MQANAHEKTWIAHARRGDEQAFTRIVEAYQVPVYNLCHRMLGNPAEAEDAAQETFMKAYRALHRYDPQRKFVTWLLSIAFHHCIDCLRRRRMRIFSFDELLPSQQKPADALGPEAAVSRREEQDAVRRLLDQLGGQDRAAVVMRYWYDMSYEEIAQSLSTSVSAVKSRLHRARRKMAQRWMEDKATAVVRRGQRDEASAL